MMTRADIRCALASAWALDGSLLVGKSRAHLRVALSVTLLASGLLSCGRPNPPEPRATVEAKTATPTADAAGQKDPADEKRHSDIVTLSAEAQRNAGVVVARAEISSVAELLRLTGTVQPIDNRVAHVRPLARGRLTEVLVRLGDRVRAGQALARLDNIEAGDLASQHASARAELERLKVLRAQADRQAARTRRLTEIGAVPQRDYELAQTELRSAEESIRAQESAVAGLAARLKRLGVDDPSSPAASLTAIRSPIAGVVTATEAAPNEVVETATELFTVTDLSRVYVVGQLYEKDLGQVREGQQASITVAPYPEQRFTGRVVSISNVLDPDTRTAAVRIEVPNSDARLKLDLFATVELPTAMRRQALVVPAGAVQRVEDKTVVFVRRSPTEFEARPVTVGATTAGQTQIASGLRPGDSVVTQGAFRLKSVLQAGELSKEE